jgi:hypothetical protein
LTQPQFADLLEVGMATAVRYELSLAPHGRMLVKLAKIAQKNNFPQIAQVFLSALSEELGVVTLRDLHDPGIRRNPVKPPCRPEDLPQVYWDYVRSLTRRGFRTIRAIQLRFYASDGREYVADVALPQD